MNLFKMEQFAERAFRVKQAYIDITGDLVAGILLGQIVYWHTPGRDGRSKLAVERYGRKWLAKRRDEWHDEIRISPKQYDRAIKILEEKGFIRVHVWHFQNRKTPHITLERERLEAALQSILTDGENTDDPILTDGENASSPKGKMHFDQRAKSSYSKDLKLLTETTTKTTARENAPGAADVFDRFFHYFGKMPNAFQVQKIGDHLDAGMEPELMMLFFEKAALANAGYNYADAALLNIQRQGIYTMDAYQQAEQERRARQDAKHRRDHGRTAEESGSAYKHENPDFSDVDLDDL